MAFTRENHDCGVFLSLNEKSWPIKGSQPQFRFDLSINDVWDRFLWSVTFRCQHQRSLAVVAHSSVVTTWLLTPRKNLLLMPSSTNFESTSPRAQSSRTRPRSNLYWDFCIRKQTLKFVLNFQMDRRPSLNMASFGRNDTMVLVSRTISHSEYNMQTCITWSTPILSVFALSCNIQQTLQR